MLVEETSAPAIGFTVDTKGEATVDTIDEATLVSSLNAKLDVIEQPSTNAVIRFFIGKYSSSNLFVQCFYHTWECAQCEVNFL